MSATAETKPVPTAKQIGIKWLKIYGICYAAIFVLYIVHLLCGYEAVALKDIGQKRFLWKQTVFQLEGQQVDLEAGIMLSPEDLEKYAKYVESLPEKQREEQGKLLLFKKNAIKDFWYLLRRWNFFGLLLLLYTALGDLIPRALADYGDKVRRNLETARAAKRESQMLNKKQEGMRVRVEHERAKLRARAEEESDRYYKHLLHQTHQDIARMRETFQRYLETQESLAAQAMRKRSAEEALEAAREKLKGAAGTDMHHAQVDAFLEQLEGVKI